MKASQNAIRHALTSTRTLVGNEDANEYHQLRGALFTDYAPANIQEQILVDRIASATWRTLRARQMEQSLSNMSIDNFQLKRKHPVARTCKTDTEALVLSMVEDDLWRLMHRYDTQISRDFFKSINTLEKMQSDRRLRDHRDRKDALQDQKLALSQEHEARQPQHTKAAAAGDWLPFENATQRANTATAKAQPAAQTSPQSTVGQVSQPVVATNNPG